MLRCFCALRARQRLGKYRIERRLAEGGFARVYAAVDTVEGLRVGQITAQPVETRFGYHIIKVTDKFRRVVIFATIGVMVLYLGSFIFSLFGGSLPFLNGDNMLLSILFSVFVCGLAAMNLALDFDFIEKGAKQQLDKIEVLSVAPLIAEALGAVLLTFMIACPRHRPGRARGRRRHRRDERRRRHHE